MAKNEQALSPEERVSKMWARAAEDDFRAKHLQTNWMGHPEVQRHVSRACSGSPDRNWLDHFRDAYFQRRAREVVNLGCGEGALERELIGRDFGERYVGYDLSAPCIERARATVGKEHPEAQFFCADLNHIELPRAAFEVAFFSHAFHHVERLEHLCEEVRVALRPDGFLLVQEFVGPTRMQWTDKQMAIANRLFAQFSPALATDISRLPERVPRPPIARMSVADWLRCDPSECVRSADILGALAGSFEILERHDVGGTLLQKLLENVVGNFDFQDEAHSTIIRLLIEFERILIEEGIVGSDFTFIVARPRMG